MPSIPPPAHLFEHRPGVWLKESWLRFSGLTLQTRMVLLQVDDALALYSPSPAQLDPATIEEIRAHGEPRWLIAPNEIHNVGLRAFQAAFPAAHTTGCVGHPRRVKDVRFDVLLDTSSAPDAVPWTQSGELRFHVIGGNRLLHEIAVLYVPSAPRRGVVRQSDGGVEVTACGEAVEEKREALECATRSARSDSGGGR